MYPHDDNQGGFFVAVLERVEDDGSKHEGDEDPWTNTKIRQKPVLDELAEFSAWYEEQYKKHCEENNIPEEDRTKLGMVEMIEQAKLKEQKENEELGIPCGNLSQMKKQKQEMQEMTEFPFSNLVKNKPDIWFKLLDFFGIDPSFPSDYLYRY